MEIWKPIAETNGLYEISTTGCIKRGKRILKANTWNIYKVVRLKLNGKYKTCYVHRLVAEAFIANPENKDLVNHKDGNKLNNSVNNLEWCTKQENEKHAWEHGLKEKIRITSKENAKIARLYINNKIPVMQTDMNGNLIKIWDSATDAMKELKIDGSAITKCCRGKLKQSGGYRWQYIK